MAGVGCPEAGRHRETRREIQPSAAGVARPSAAPSPARGVPGTRNSHPVSHLGTDCSCGPGCRHGGVSPTSNRAWPLRCKTALPVPNRAPQPGLGQLRSREQRSSQRGFAQVSVLHSSASSCCGVGGTQRPGVTAGSRGTQRRKAVQQRGCGHAEPGDAGWGCILSACVCKTCRERGWEP